MELNGETLAFGPVPSRRLGKSLGINHIPPKICSYSCIYCQLGRTHKMRVDRKNFYSPEKVVQAVKNKVKKARKKKEHIDYLTFVPDGEPTLDGNLGEIIRLLKPIGIKIAVITNSSLIWMPDVQDELSRADFVSIKIDAISQDIWKMINRPHGSLNLPTILEGLVDFSDSYTGYLVTETMLIKDINDDDVELEKISDFISTLNIKKGYLSIPTRPPAETWVQPAAENRRNTAYHMFDDKLFDVEYLTGYEGHAFASTGNIEEDILSITSVHPMRKDTVQAFLGRTRENWTIINRLIKEDKLVEIEYKDKKFYMRKFLKKQNHCPRGKSIK